MSTKHYITNVIRRNNDYTENNVYNKYENRTFNYTNNITKHINNHSNGATHSYDRNNINNVNKTYYNFNGGITLNKTSNQYSNDTYMAHTITLKLIIHLIPQTTRILQRK